MKSFFIYYILFVSLSSMQQIHGRSMNPINAPTHTSSHEKHLTINSSRFLCPNTAGDQCFYEAFSLNPSITGDYHFVIDSDIDISFYLYQAPFNPTEPNTNIIFNGDPNNHPSNVRFATLLYAHNPVILVITTQYATPDSPLKVTIEGPSMVDFQTDDYEQRVPVTTTRPTRFQNNDLSPLIKRFSWGRVKVEGYDQYFKDVKLFPGGAESWDWREFGTRHNPGIHPDEVKDLLKYKCDTIILSRGVDKQLKTMAKTRAFLERHGYTRLKTYFIMPSEDAVERYNEFAKKKQRVCALIHSTC